MYERYGRIVDITLSRWNEEIQTGSIRRPAQDVTTSGLEKKDIDRKSRRGRQKQM